MTDASDQRRAATIDSATGVALIDAAIRLIQSDGVTAATSRAIADDANANLGAITYYYGSKDALIAQALVEIGRSLLAPAIEALTSTASPIEQLQRAVALLPTVLGDNPDSLRGYVHALAAAVTDPAVRDALASLHHEITDLLAAQITNHQQDGAIPTWVRPAEMASTIVALVDGVAVNTAADLARSSPTAIATEFAALLLHTSATPGS